MVMAVVGAICWKAVALMFTVALLIVRPPAAGIAYQASKLETVWPVCVKVLVLKLSITRDTFALTVTILVPPGKLALKIVIPGVKPDVFESVRVLDNAVTEPPPWEA